MPEELRDESYVVVHADLKNMEMVTALNEMARLVLAQIEKGAGRSMPVGEAKDEDDATRICSSADSQSRFHLHGV